VKIKSLLTVGILASAVASPVMAAETMSAEQQQQIETVVHNYLLKNPEVLVEVSQVLQKKQQQNMQQQAKSAILDSGDQLLAGTMSVAGNPKGNVTLIEFFDYQCIHCKKMAPVISELIKKDSNLRVVYKEFPIFGGSSEYASKAVLAASMQGKYLPLHEALLALDKRLDPKLIMSTAKSVGLDTTKLEKDMASKLVSDELAASRALAEKLHLMGTPAFIIAATPGGKFSVTPEPAFIPGGASVEDLQALIKKASKKA